METEWNIYVVCGKTVCMKRGFQASNAAEVILFQGRTLKTAA